MSAKRLALAAFILIFVWGVWQLVALFPDLPAQTLTRIEDGKDILLPKALVGMSQVAVMVGCLIYCVMMALFAHKLPDRYLKILPHSEYWLAPARREQTVAGLQSHLLWLGNATLGMFLAAFQILYMVNAGADRSHLTTTSGLISTLYLTYVFLGLLAMKNRFKRVPPGV